MGCGCNKRKSAVTTAPPSGLTAIAATPSKPAVIMYDVFDNEGGFVASYSNPVNARTEARRVNGSSFPRNADSPIGSTATIPTITPTEQGPITLSAQ